MVSKRPYDLLMTTTLSMIPKMSTAALKAALDDIRGEYFWDCRQDAIEHEISERLGAQLIAELGLDVEAEAA